MGLNLSQPRENIRVVLFTTERLCILPIYSIYLLHMNLKIDSKYFPKHH